MYSVLCAVFGLACHIGVQLQLPSVGVAKTLYHTDGIENNEEHHQKVCHSTTVSNFLSISALRFRDGISKCMELKLITCTEGVNCWQC